jgi:SAM-dependent methyltransferase
MTGPAETGTPTQSPLSPGGRILLSHLESSRDLLARRLVRDSPAITGPDLNYLTISSLLQVLFLRTGQECGFVEPGTFAALAGCEGIAKRMGRACSDAGLNPDLFFERGLVGSPAAVSIPDEPLREIILTSDRQDIPSSSARLPLEELAAVFEHFLGTRLDIGEGYRVICTGKSALLYTGIIDVPPQIVIEYAARTAIREIGGRPASRILDPACGSGLFLLAAYRILAGKILQKNRSHQEKPGQTVAALQEILRTSVFGTDIDPESVSAARFVLLLAFFEESRKACRDPVNPDRIRDACAGLLETIRCGNALIAPDYFSGKPIFPFNAEERRRVNAFDWQEAFPEILSAGGFDAVIGSPPPYRPFAVKAREEYFQTHYDSYAVSAGLYAYFIEKGLGLLRPGGYLGYLVPGTFLRSQNARPLRRLLLTRQIVHIAQTGKTRHLPEADAPQYLLTLKNQPPNDPFTVSPEFLQGRYDFPLDQRLLDDGGWKLDDTRTTGILEKTRMAGTLLEQYVLDEIGVGTYHVRNNPLVVDLDTRNRLTKRAWWARRFFIPLLRPADIRRYLPEKPSRFAIVDTGNRKIRKCRALVHYLEQAGKGACTVSGCDTLPGEPEISQERSDEIFFPEHRMQKIIFPLFQHKPAFSLDPDGIYSLTSTLAAIPRNDPYLVAILNSSLGRFILRHTCLLTDRGYHMSPAALGKFPVMVPDFEKRADRKRHDKIAALVAQMISLHEYLPQAKTDQERRLVQQEIDATDVRIDALVYELYGLTPEEIAVVEMSTALKSPCLHSGPHSPQT